MKYKEIINKEVNLHYIERENADGTFSSIPIDEGNSDYQRYLRWLENPNAELGGTL